MYSKILIINDDMFNKLENKRQSARYSSNTKSRRISPSCKLRILKRDKFKCQKCGNSPAIDNLCILHIDHVFPFVMGGTNIESNLQTLCSNCNLSKSTKIENII